MKIEYTENPTEEFENKISDGLGSYEEEKGIDIGYKKYAFVLADNKDIIGGLTGYTAFEEIYIDDLWVDKKCRGKGYGKMLVDKVYEKFKNKGFDNINLCTNGFQAPKFYEKCGYQLEFVRKKKNPKLTKYFFIKRFS